MSWEEEGWGGGAGPGAWGEGEDSWGEGEGVEQDYGLQWDVDRVDLGFQTVEELEALLAERGLSLDYRLFRETDQVDAQLREELQHHTLSASLTSLSRYGASLYPWSHPNILFRNLGAHC